MVLPPNKFLLPLSTIYPISLIWAKMLIINAILLIENVLSHEYRWQQLSFRCGSWGCCVYRALESTFGFEGKSIRVIVIPERVYILMGNICMPTFKFNIHY